MSEVVGVIGAGDTFGTVDAAFHRIIDADNMH